MHGLANPAYPSRFPYYTLPCVALYCVPGGVKVVSVDAGFATFAFGLPLGSPARVVVVCIAALALVAAELSVLMGVRNQGAAVLASCDPALSP